MIHLEEEKKIFDQGFQVVAGIDEAGRGPLAGPVVAACVLMKADFDPAYSQLRLINDSKKLTPAKREMLYDVIMDSFLDIGIGICDHETIDRINILQASFLAMKKALGMLKHKPDFLLVDGKFIIPNCSYAQKAIIDGDALVFSVGAASIIAKVTRDRIMRDMARQFPDYGFEKHKGYGTKLHKEKLRQFGPCIIHRKSFEPIRSLCGRG